MIDKRAVGDLPGPIALDSIGVSLNVASFVPEMLRLRQKRKAAS